MLAVPHTTERVFTSPSLDNSDRRVGSTATYSSTTHCARHSQAVVGPQLTRYHRPGPTRRRRRRRRWLAGGLLETGCAPQARKFLRFAPTFQRRETRRASVQKVFQVQTRHHKFARRAHPALSLTTPSPKAHKKLCRARAVVEDDRVLGATARAADVRRKTRRERLRLELALWRLRRLVEAGREDIDLVLVDLALCGRPHAHVMFEAPQARSEFLAGWVASFLAHVRNRLAG